MPYKKGSIAEQLGNLRKTAKRRIKSLEREMGRASDKDRIFYQSQIDSLRKTISQTYQRNPYTYKATGYTQDELRLAAQNLERQNEYSRLGRGSQARRNFITQQELNHAMSYSFIGPIQGTPEFTREEVSIFYRATQHAWEGMPVEKNRNEAILKYYNRTDLRSFVREVLELNQKAVSESKEYTGEVSEETTDAELSYAYMSYVKSADAIFLQEYVEPEV